MRVEETFSNVIKSLLMTVILRPMIWFQEGIDKEEVKTHDGRVFWLVKLGSKRAVHPKDLCMPIGLARVRMGSYCAALK